MRIGQVFGTAGWAISLVAVQAACGAGSGSARTEQQGPIAVGPPEALAAVGTHFVPGESMRFELSLRGILGGEAAMAVGQPGQQDGRSLLIVRSRVESAGVVAVFKRVQDEVMTSIDVVTGLPVEHHANVKFGKKERIIETTFADGQPGDFDVAVQRLDREQRGVHRQSMPADLAAYDAHSVLGALRAWRGEEGQHIYLYSLIGQRLWQNTLRMTGRERIRTRLGRFDAIRIDGVARRMRRNLREDTRKPPRYFTIWLSDDEQRLPILVTGKTEYGDVKAELVDYNQPAPLHATN